MEWNVRAPADHRLQLEPGEDREQGHGHDPRHPLPDGGRDRVKLVEAEVERQAHVLAAILCSDPSVPSKKETFFCGFQFAFLMLSLYVPGRELDLVARGARRRERHVHGAEGFGVGFHVADAIKPGNIILVNLKWETYDAVQVLEWSIRL